MAHLGYIEQRGEQMKKWKWLIIEVVCIVAGILGFYFCPPMHNASPIALLAIIFGLYWAGYAAARLDDKVGGVRIHVEIKRWKPHIEITPLRAKQ